MTGKGQDPIAANRIDWLDNLRTFMIFLVVALHAGLVYESSGIGASFWIVDDPSTNHLSGILNLIIDIIAMPTIFFISGFLVPLSLKHKTKWAFLRSKFRRLMIPWAVAVLTLLPLYKVIFLNSRGLPQEHWTTYFHWSNGIWGMNWMWFLPVLFLFNMLYLFLSGLNIRMPNITLNKAIGTAFLIGLIYSFCIDLLNGQGWTKTLLIDFQNERLLIYFLIFLVGSLCFKLKTFDVEPTSNKLYVLVSCTVWIPMMMYAFLVIYSLVRPGEYIFSGTTHLLLIRVAFLLSLLFLLYVLVRTFSFYLNRSGRIGRELNRNAYEVYIIHVIIMGGIALAMLDTTMPSLLKNLTLTLSTYALSNLVIYAFKKAVAWRISVRDLKFNCA